MGGVDKARIVGKLDSRSEDKRKIEEALHIEDIKDR